MRLDASNMPALTDRHFANVGSYVSQTVIVKRFSAKTGVLSIFVTKELPT